MYIDFETMQREVVIWLDNAEDVLQELDQLKEDAELSDRHVNKFKVQYIFALFRYAALQQSVASITPIMAKVIWIHFSIHLLSVHVKAKHNSHNIYGVD